MGLQDVMWATNSLRQVVLVMDYAAHGSLARHIRTASKEGRSMDEGVCRLVGYQLLLALAFLHYKGIMHRDVKPDNVLIVKWRGDFIRIKLSDFGIAKVITSTEQGVSKVGSTGFVAPEVEFRHPEDAPYTFTADIWSFGATMIKW